MTTTGDDKRIKFELPFKNHHPNRWGTHLYVPSAVYQPILLIIAIDSEDGTVEFTLGERTRCRSGGPSSPAGTSRRTRWTLLANPLTSVLASDGVLTPTLQIAAGGRDARRLMHPATTRRTPVIYANSDLEE